MTSMHVAMLHTPPLSAATIHRLSDHGFVVEPCAHGDDACPAERGEPCPVAIHADVLVCDGWREGPDMASFLRRVRSVHPGLPIVMLERAVDEETLREFGDGAIVTSVGRADHERLLPLIQEALGGYPEAMLGLVG
jgi:DNA-binding NtrC family response regulator